MYPTSLKSHHPLSYLVIKSLQGTWRENKLFRDLKSIQYALFSTGVLCVTEVWTSRYVTQRARTSVTGMNIYSSMLWLLGFVVIHMFLKNEEYASNIISKLHCIGRNDIICLWITKDQKKEVSTQLTFTVTKPVIFLELIIVLTIS